MYRILLVILTLSVSSEASSGENTPEKNIDALYNKFNQEIMVFKRSGVPLFVLESQYNRMSSKYFQKCNADFSFHRRCEVFQQKFDTWHSIDGGGKICKIKRCLTQ